MCMGLFTLNRTGGNMRYCEIGTVGLSTEIEHETGEIRLPGLHAQGVLVSVYARLRLGRVQIVIDSKEGLKVRIKDVSHLRFVIGAVFREMP